LWEGRGEKVKYPYWVVVPWHYGPNEIKNPEDEEKFKRELKEEIEEIKRNPEEAFFILRSEAERPTEEIVKDIMERKFSTFEEAEKAWDLMMMSEAEREKWERLRGEI